MNGKGDKRRKGANDALYRTNWEIIFGGGGRNKDVNKEAKSKEDNEQQQQEKTN